MKNGCLGVGSGGIGLQRTFKATGKDHLQRSVNLPEKNDQVCVWYHLEGYLSRTMENGRWCVASGGIVHRRSFEVITQGHMMKKMLFK